ncbi:hypothetical protein AXF42_Ash001591 [Apostasia shenzhenica]|uniref:Uncharacterized protein n=1 Tax=Apostasia shenzhenica TaxID=1088818 RepID=A0A2I0AAN2_9ASPA|nr:hypothetical protein AXF42_Ash001591 [Apostasia shenzhenica]
MDFSTLTNNYHKLFSKLMEEANDCSIKRDALSGEDLTSSDDQESSWTQYFIASQKDDKEPNGCSTVAGGSTSTVSDATSQAPRKSSAVKEPTVTVSCKSLSFKKRKSMAIGGMEENMDLMSTTEKKDDCRGICHEVNHQLKDVDCDENRSELKRGVSDGIELKEKGLCLVPLSMIVDFLRQ